MRLTFDLEDTVQGMILFMWTGILKGVERTSELSFPACLLELGFCLSSSILELILDLHHHLPLFMGLEM